MIQIVSKSSTKFKKRLGSEFKAYLNKGLRVLD
jgi:hypothetical protein